MISRIYLTISEIWLISRMKLSNKKIKAIKRLSSEKNAKDIAEELRVSLKDVEKVLGVNGDKPRRATRVSLEGVCRWLAVILVLVAPFMHLRKIYDFANLPQLAFLQIGLVLLLFLWLAKGLTIGKLAVLKSPYNLPILLFLLWSLVSLIHAHNRYEGLTPWMHWTACGLMFMLVAALFQDPKQIRQLMTAVFISGFLVSLLGIGQHLFQVSWVPQVVKPAATFANRNMAVHFVVLSLPIGPAFILDSKNRIRNWALFLASSLMVTYLIYCETRAGWVAFGAQFLLFTGLIIRDCIVEKNRALWDRHKTFGAIAALVVFLMLVNFGPDGFQPKFGQLLQRTATVTTFDKNKFEAQDVGDTSIGLRYAIWLNTLEMIKDHPWIGLGLGNHKLFYPLYHRKVVREREFSETAQLSNVHNDYLQAFSELGLIGMLFLGWIAAVFLWTAWRLTSSRHPRSVRFLAMGIAVGIIGLAINAVFSFPMERSVPPFLLMSYLGILASLQAGADRRFHALSRKGVIFCMAIVTFVLWIFLIRFYHRSILCDRYFLKVTQLEKLKRWSGLVVEGRKAFQYNPYRIKTLSYIGRAHIEMGQHREGIEALKQVIAAYPNHMNALLNLGVAYGSVGEHEQALETYRKVLTIKPDYAKAHNNMANIYMKQKKLEKALEEFEIAAKDDDQNPIIHFNIGIVQMKFKKFQESANAFEKTIALNPRWDLAQKNLGILYFQFLGRQQEGLAHLQKALELNPKIKDAQQIKNLIGRFSKQTPPPPAGKTP